MTRVIFITVLISLSSFSFSQNVKDLKANDAIPFDPAVRYGKLANGLTYYILKNDTPKGKIEMRLVVNAGTFFEDEDQLELAHLTEHMAFEGTKHFPGNSLLSYTASNGLTFGNEINASTGGNKTTYKLTIPSNKPPLLNDCMQILRDWAGDMVFDTIRVNAQRGVVAEEKRRGELYDVKMHWQMQYEVSDNPLYALDYKQKYLDNLKTFKYNALIRFYKDWYRPNLQAIIIVGDIDEEKIEKQIKTLFSDLRNPENSRPVENWEGKWKANLSGKNKLIRVTNPSMNDFGLFVFNKRPGVTNQLSVVNEYRALLVDELYSQMVKKRFVTLQRQYNSPFKSANSNFDRNYVGSTFIDVLMMMAKFGNVGEIEKGFKDLIVKTEQVKRFGFSQFELNEAKKKMSLDLQASSTFMNSSQLVTDFINHFINGYSAPSPTFQFGLKTRLLKEIKLEAINAFAKKWSDFKQDRDIVIMAPENSKSLLPNEADFDKWFADVQTMKLQMDKDAGQPIITLLDSRKLIQPKKGTETEIANKETGITELKLSNGIKVVLRPYSNNGSNQISFMGISSGGTNKYKGFENFIAENVAGIVANSGIGSFNKFQIADFLKNKKVSVSPFIFKQSAQINGSCKLGDLETLLQLTYLYLIDPRKDTTALQDWKSSKKVQLQAELKNIENNFEKEVYDLKYVKYKMASVSMPSAAKFDKINIDDAYRIYKESFSTEDGFTFFITGAFDPKKIKELLRKYLGNLPAVKTEVKPTEEKVEQYLGKIDIKIYQGQYEKAEVRLFFPSSNNYLFNVKNNFILDVLGKAFEFKIYDRLRTKEGGVYSPSITPIYYRESKDSAGCQFAVRFSCAPDNTDKMIGAVVEELKALASNGPDQELFTKAMAATKSPMLNREANLSSMQLKAMYYNNENPAEYFNQKKVVEEITMDDIKNAAKEFLTDKNIQRFVLLPESYKPKK